eukprot:3359701-Prymnesium_polylepis.1
MFQNLVTRVEQSLKWEDTCAWDLRALSFGGFLLNFFRSDHGCAWDAFSACLIREGEQTRYKPDVVQPSRYVVI